MKEERLEDRLRECPNGHSGNIKIELWGDWFTAACQEKGCGWQNGFWETEEEAATAWNTRATDPLLKRMAEALKELIILMEDTRDGAYKPDHLTTQPARIVVQEYIDHVGQQSGERG